MGGKEGDAAEEATKDKLKKDEEKTEKPIPLDKQSKDGFYDARKAPDLPGNKGSEEKKEEKKEEAGAKEEKKEEAKGEKKEEGKEEKKEEGKEEKKEEAKGEKKEEG